MINPHNFEKHTLFISLVSTLLLTAIFLSVEAKGDGKGSLSTYNGEICMVTNGKKVCGDDAFISERKDREIELEKQREVERKRLAREEERRIKQEKERILKERIYNNCIIDKMPVGASGSLERAVENECRLISKRPTVLQRLWYK